jgi:FAD/FMN-containing dehydrogenase
MHDPHATAARPLVGPVQALRAAVRGRVHLPGEDGYDAARLGWRRIADPRPALVVEAAGAQDVVAAVRFARERGLPVTVKATGHGAIGPCEGLLLVTSWMSAVQVHPDRHTARVGGGAVWGQVIAAAAPSGLAPLSGSAASVGVAGSTLGGGLGWLSRRHGFAADTLLSATLVTADGQLETASPREHPEVHWALRGGGGNFGVVTALTLRLHPVERLYGGEVVFAIERAARALARYREWAPGEPDACATELMLRRLPAAPWLPGAPRDRPVLALRTVYQGGEADAERALTPLRAAAGPPLLDGLRPLRAADPATVFGPPPPPAAIHSRAELLHALPDAVIGSIVAAVEGGPLAVEVRHWGGAMARPAEGAGHVGHRDVPFSVTVTASADDHRRSDQALGALVAGLAPHATGGSFLNFLTDPARTATAYTSWDYRLLAAVKRAYDPDNVFSGNHNIPPAAPRGLQP